jgi:hypothetical protein
MEKEVVKFVSAKPYLNVSNEEFDKLFFCLHGRKEVVVLCSSELKDKLKNLPSNYLQPRLIDIKNYLNTIGVQYIEDFSNTTTV